VDPISWRGPYIMAWTQLTSFKNRQILAKFRISDHCLQIETGRYKNIPVNKDYVTLEIFYFFK
jgi:hypothetical protein